ncbi:MAG: hypothetical protein A3J83_01915 [Elusimicrobia bacterium RIFOXYA2_FULL_40_6]|nr:MAG: hypothetical protein A3J83_01915 [Elusimicrobia bacterium RIFOXYA2_FULL_40_6]
MKKSIIFILALFFSVNAVSSSQTNRLVFTQLEYNGECDPYPSEYPDILNFLTLTTSIDVLPERRVIKLNDGLLFSSSLLIMLNSGKFNGFSQTERETLKKYINGGGILFIEDSTGGKYSDFDRKIRKELEYIFPDKRLSKLSKEHALFRAFYLLRGIAGRYITNNYLEGIDVSGRTAVIYSQNDMFGAWVRDRFGNYFLECIPGGENQRFEAQKLTINLLVYSVAGTYKNDFIHKKFIEEKLRR